MRWKSGQCVLSGHVGFGEFRVIAAFVGGIFSQAKGFWLRKG
jgi:hypothetical protein